MPKRPYCPEDEDDYDSGDPFSCIAAGADGKEIEPTYFYQVSQCYEGKQKFEDLVEKDIRATKAALYDVWQMGRAWKEYRSEGEWAAQQMASLGDLDRIRRGRSR